MNDLNFTTQSSFLHHGIQGQKWGVQNGPPYPLDRATAKEVKKQAKRDLNNTEAVKKMNKGSMIGAAVGQFVAGPIGAGAGASLGSYIAFNKLSPEVKNEYYDKVKKYSDAKDQYKIVKKYEKVSLKEAKADFNGDKVKSITNGKKNREPYEFEKGSSTPNSKIPPAEKAAREEVRKAWEKANSDPSANNMAPIPRSALRKLAAAEIKNPNIHDENGKPYISVDDYIKRNYGNDWGQYEADTWEIVIG